MKKAITQTAETVYDHFSPAEQTIARGIFLRLTQLGEGVQDTRRRVKLDELVQTKEQEAVAKVLKTLTDARLVTTEQDSAEVAHEALIREWGTLRKWLDEDRESLRLHCHLTESAQEWQRRGREAGELYRGTRLGQIQDWMKGHSEQLSRLEREFLKASQNIKRQERLRLAALAIVGVILLVVSVLGVRGRLNPFLYRPVDMENYWVTIPAGEFIMGTAEGGNGEIGAGPVHTVYLGAYQIGRYEVTNRQYAQCARAGICSPLRDVRAEWEKAGSWDDQTKTKRRYPWGETIDCTYANYSGKNGGNDYCVGDTTPVGSYESGKSPYGLYDMAGNLGEWVNSLSMPYPYDANDGREDMNSADLRVVRGGAWGEYGAEIFVSSTYRVRLNPMFRYTYIGFRCARDTDTSP